MIKKIFIILFTIVCNITPVMAVQTDVITTKQTINKTQYQNKTYNIKDKDIIIKAILNVLQDDGYIINTVNPLLGFIYGSKDYNTSNSEVDLSKEFDMTNARLKVNGVKVATLETNVNLTDYKTTLKVRITFRKKLLNSYGNAQFIDEINDAQYYKDFYAKLDREIFLIKQGI